VGALGDPPRAVVSPAAPARRRVYGRWGVRALALCYLIWTPLAVAGLFAPGATPVSDLIFGAVAVVSLGFAIRTARVAVVSEPDRLIVRNTLSTRVVPRADIDCITMGRWRGVQGHRFPVGVVWLLDGGRIACLALNPPVGGGGGVDGMVSALQREQDVWRHGAS
jgi:hypothetical protein